MTKYIVKLSEQEEMQLRQLVLTPGFEPLLKLLQGESLDAQSAAMESKGTKERRLMLLTDAQSTAKVVSNLTRKLCSYREIMAPTPDPEADDPLGFNVFDERKAN